MTKHAVLDAVPRPRVLPLHPPGGVRGDGDPCLALHVAELPLGASPELLDVEALRDAEVALAAGGEADLRADPRDAEALDDVVLEIEPDHVPGAVLRQKRVRVDGPLALVVTCDRPVGEPHRPLLRDRRLELAEPALELRGVVGVAHLDADRGRGRGGPDASRASEREVLEREPERLGVGEPSLEEEEARLKRCELVVVEVERWKEVALGAERVELLARELVPLRVERDPEADELGPVGVEAAGERLVAHLLVALDVPLDVARRQRAQLGHEERDQRELADQLVGVVAHSRFRA